MNSLKIAFFTEAGSKRGMGHLIRSYTIYEEFKYHNKIEADFFLDSDISFDYKFDDLKYFSWDKFFLDKKYDVIFMDSYEADYKIYENISKNSKVAVYIDDYKRLDYPKGIIINFLPDASNVFYKDKKSIHTHLLGLDFLPIRKDFFSNSVKKENQVFIMLGGSDIKGLSFDIIKAIESIDIKKILVLNQKKDIEKFKKFKNLEILYKPEDSLLIENMKKSKIAICTASMTCYELSFLKIPTILFVTSKNQEIGVSQLLNYKVSQDFIDIQSKDWHKHLNKTLNSLIRENKQIKSCIDGLGCQRIFKLILRKV